MALAGTELTWAAREHVIAVSLQNFRATFAQFATNGITHIVFAGSVERPAASDSLDNHSKREVGSIDTAGGDDAILRSTVRLVESWGFKVIGPHEILPELVAKPGVLTKTQPSEQDRRDVVRAEEIVRVLGSVDVGQAAVVANLICIAVETVAGTNAMLSGAAGVLSRYRPAPGTAVGVMFKAPKPNQEIRVDMPVIGPDTILQAAAVNIRGVAIEAGGVMILEQDRIVQSANANNIFVWSRIRPNSAN